MDQRLLLSTGSLPLDLEQQVDRLCDEFENELKSQKVPDVERYLARIHPSAHRQLVREISQLLREYLSQDDLANGAALSYSSTEAMPASDHGSGLVCRASDDGEATREYLRQSLKLVQDMDAASTRFEESLAQGNLPSIEQILAAVDRNARPRLLRELLKLEMEFRSKKGETPALQEFLARFPEERKLVKYLYCEHFTPSRMGGFSIARLLGRGGFGHVYQAWDPKLSRHVAIKVFRRDPDEIPHAVGGLLVEARAAAQLRHPGIVSVHAVIADDDGDEFVVLEYVDGRSLEDLLHSKKLDPTEAAQLMLSVCQALAHAHDHGLVHRDLKPANILLDQRGRPRITDFGLALHASDLRRSPDIAGTLPYMAPEQASGETHLLDGRTDLWAVGVILYRCLSGWLPFAGSSWQELLTSIRRAEPTDLRQHDPSIPDELERIVHRCLAKQMSERYQAASDVADDLRAFLAPEQAERDDAPIAIRGRGAPPIIPKGLRAFDENDQDFFLRLLPGPCDRRGVPESIRFWEARLRELDCHRTFRVGLLHGPSGCGKSSLLRAGILPHLGSNVHVLLIEARRDQLVPRLAKALQERFAVETHNGLTATLAELREGRVLPTGEKVLIVVDQFEQWLHGWQRDQESELVDGLRQCDGGRVQALLLVRDDFWTPALRFFKRLDVPLLDGTNAAAVDLFDVMHATSVLRAFGVAYGRLPSVEAELTLEHRRFLERVVHQLTHDGAIAPVRLSVFAEMAKSRPWIPATLRNFGGARGLEIAFLEETFDNTGGAPTHRRHCRAARRVLEQLLPPPGIDIRGHLVSEAELRACSGHEQEPAEFAELMTCLDRDLRLVTPVDSAGLTTEGTQSTSDVSGVSMYQLTHDFLVASVRDWLNQTRRRTVRGRAELRLADAARAYATRPETRELPSWWEWLGILLLTRRRRWRDPERTLMRAASRQYTMQLGAGLAIAILLGILLYSWTATIRARGLVDTLASSDGRDVPLAIERLTEQRRWVTPILRERLATAEPQSDEWTRLMLGSLSVGAVQSSDVEASILHADLGLSLAAIEVADRCGALPSMAPKLLDRAADQGAPRGERLRACAALAQLTTARVAGLPPVPADAANLLLQEVSQHPRYFDLWVDALAPLRSSLITLLIHPFADPHVDESTRMLAAEMLAKYAANDPQQLIELVLQADPRQFNVVAEPAVRHSQAFRSALGREVTRAVPDAVSEDEKDQLARRRANAILLSKMLDDETEFWPALRHSPDPRLRTYLLNHFRVSQLPADWQTRMTSDPDPGVRQAMSLAIGFGLLSAQAVVLPPDIKKMLLHALANDPDPGCHSAIEWTLRKAGYDMEVDMAVQHLATLGLRPGYRWYVTKSLLTMIVVRTPGEVVLGSPSSEPSRDASDEAMWNASIDWTYAISATEITRDLYNTLCPDSPAPSSESTPDKLCPVNAVSALDAEKFCRSLAKRDELAEYQESRSSSATAEDYPHSYYSYRLPTEAEWEVACRAGTASPRYFGYSPELLPDFACYIANSNARTWPVRQGIPNAWGLFDMLGNVSEWCEDVYIMDRSSGSPPGRPAAALRPLSYLVVRGSDFNSLPGMVRSANRRSAEARGTAYTRGFRIARTIAPEEIHE